MKIINTRTLVASYEVGQVDDVEEGKHYFEFYSTFGGLNSKLGAKSEFEIILNETDTAIYFERQNGFECILEKDSETGLWQYSEK